MLKLRVKKNWKEKTSDAIIEYSKDCFTALDLQAFLPGRPTPLITNNLIQLTRDGFIYRTGKRTKGIKPKSSFVQYTISEALSAKAIKDTSLRGYSSEDRRAITGKNRITELEKEIIILKKCKDNLKIENKKMRSILTKLPYNQLLNLLLED